MCGIAGIIGRLSDRNRHALSRMTDAIAHRGPDSAGFWTSTPDARGHGCLFGHRRLKIIDLSTAADQPMTDPHRPSHTIIFNGEIYNFQDLRRDLESRGERFQSTGDTAVMLRLLALEGHPAVGKLRGMFAFALWDDAARTLTLARDPLGIKPLYVCDNTDPNGEWSLLFASEVRSILASGLIDKPRLDRRAIASVVWNGFVAGPNTAVEGIESLRPGEVQVLDASGKPRVSELYWHMPAADAKGEMTEGGVREALAESVKLHLIADVPLGIFLSGGIDSSAVANLAQKASSVPVNTFTLAFEEQQYNEGEFARQIAQAIGTTHHEILLTEQQFAGSLQTAIDTLDQPTFDGLNSYYISKAVREAGLTVALVGTGGDELFGGYASFRVLPTMLRWERRSRLMPRPAKVLAAQLASKVLSPSKGSSTPPQTRWAKFPDMIRAGDNLIALYQLAYALFLPEFQGELLIDRQCADEMQSGLAPVMMDRLRSEMRNHSPLSATSVLEQRLFLGERLLRDTDAASMAVSLETRLPLVDSVLAGRVSKLTDGERYLPVGRKQMLRKIGLVGLEARLFDRPKSGFVLPFDRWIRRSLGKTMDETMRDASLARAVGLNGQTVSRLWSAFQDGAPGLYWSRVWALYVLIRWCHRHRVLL
jgi:asparagine synthase (glutamine-hydrolysing)